MKNMKKILSVAFLIVNCQLSIVNCFAQSIGINEPNPDSSAILEMTSTNRGLLIPRMTTAQRDAIVSPAQSLLIFNTDDLCYQTYVGGQWNDIWCYPQFICGTTVDDPDGHTYNTVLIGSQCWLAEDLRYDGSTTGNGCRDVTWVNSSDEGWCGYYTGGPFANEGLLYQWSAIMDGSTIEGAQGLCPTGWHIPTDAEWKTLEGSLGMSVAQQDATGWRGTNEASQMANDVSSVSWTAGNLRNDAGFGSSGLNVPPSGYRHYSDGSYNGRSDNATLWSSSESGGSAWKRYLYYSVTQVHRDASGKARGYTVRCLKD